MGLLTIYEACIKCRENDGFQQNQTQITMRNTKQRCTHERKYNAQMDTTTKYRLKNDPIPISGNIMLTWVPIDRPSKHTRRHADIHKYTFVGMHTYKCRYILYTTHVDTTVSSIVF